MIEEEKTSTKLLVLMTVLIPYLILVGYSMAVYPDLPDRLENDVPRALIFIPALVSILLPLTYGIMIFFYGQYLRKAHLLLIATFMNIGILGLIGAVFLIKDSA